MGCEGRQAPSRAENPLGNLPEMDFHGLDDPGDRQADHILHGSLDLQDQPPPILLRGIGSGFVEGIDFGEISVDGRLIQGTEGDPCRLDETAAGNPSAAKQADAREDFVNPAAETAEHLDGVAPVAWLSQDLPIENDNGVGPEHQVSRCLGGYRERLELGVRQDKVPGRHSSGQLLHVGGPDDHLESGRGEQIAAARGGRSKYQTPRSGTLLPHHARSAGPGIPREPRSLDQVLGIVEPDILADRFQLAACATGGMRAVPNARDHAGDDGCEGQGPGNKQDAACAPSGFPREPVGDEETEAKARGGLREPDRSADGKVLGEFVEGKL